MRNDYVVFNKLILFTAEAYMENALKEGLSNDPVHHKIVSGVASYRTLCRFDKEQHNMILEFEDNPIVQKVKDAQMSHIIFALEILKQWVEQVPREQRKHIALGVSNKKLLKGRAAFALDMLALKKEDKERYETLREIIDDSVLMGKHFFNNAYSHFIDG